MMGMFDYIRCEMPLPETPEPSPEGLFQTKDTPDQYMTVYTITADGRLSWRPYRVEMVPEEDRPHPNESGLLALTGCLRRVESDPVVLDDYHGDIVFYTGGERDGKWWEYRARFTDGVCSSIRLVDYDGGKEVVG